MKKDIEPAFIKKLVKDEKIEFYVSNGLIYCRKIPNNGETFVVGIVEKEIESEN